MENIGRYEGLQEIGYGGMATVYKAHDPQISRTLAIKVLRAERCRDEEYRRRFIREAKAVGTLSHPNIVTVYDIGQVDNTPYIAMELLEGESLDQLMKSDYVPSCAEILDWFIQLADALEYAHQRGIIHRDIKPSNIVLSKDNKKLKITDFGIAHFDEADVTQHTQLGEVLGTPQYMSPEQVLGKQADARSDLFSLGVIMYQLLTGQKPFQADTLATLLFQIATENPEPIGQVMPALPASLKQVVDKLLKKKPEKRIQSGAELKSTLIKIVIELKHSKRQDRSGLQMSLVKKWLVVSVCSLLFLFVLGGVYLHSQQEKLLTEQLSNQGIAMSQFIAFENAEAVLSEDWTSIELFVQQLSEQDSFRRLEIVDHSNTVRGSTDVSRINAQFVALADASENTLPDAKYTVLQTESGLEYQYEADIYFQTTRIGNVLLSLDASHVSQSANKLLLNYAVISSAVVLLSSVFMILLSQPFSNVLRTVKKAINEITEGNNAHRIASPRTDEFGQLYNEIDNMAAGLQSRDEPGSANETR